MHRSRLRWPRTRGWWGPNSGHFHIAWLAATPRLGVSEGLRWQEGGRVTDGPFGQPKTQAQAQGQPGVSRRSLLRGGLVGGGLGLAVAAGAGAAVGLTRNSNPSLNPGVRLGTR